MLNENDDLSWLPGETAAAMRDLARTVTDAPPLRLTADAAGLLPARPRRRGRGPRSRWSWGAPLLAAVAVMALAVSLVTVKDLPNGRVAPRATASSPATVPPPAEGGVPEYYVALHPVSGRPGAPNGLVVGETRTGRTVAVVAPPRYATIESVSGAADDRAFAVVAAPASGGSDHGRGFYLLTIAPGSSPAARLVQLPMKPLPGVFATALSASGKELAVATATEVVTGGPVTRRLTIYSVATGRPLRSWSTADSTAIASDIMPTVRLGQYTSQYPALSWIDGDRAIAFPVLSWSLGTIVHFLLEVRSVNVTATGNDLMADSKVIVNLGGTPANTGTCGTFFPVLSGNGTTVFCVVSSGPGLPTGPATVGWVVEWRPVATPLASGVRWRSFPYARKIGVPAGSAVYPVTAWSSNSGATLLVEWTVVPPASDGTGGHGAYAILGELTLGRNQWTFTPLPAPPVFANGGAPSIAW